MLRVPSSSWGPNRTSPELHPHPRVGGTLGGSHVAGRRRLRRSVGSTCPETAWSLCPPALSLDGALFSLGHHDKTPRTWGLSKHARAFLAVLRLQVRGGGGDAPLPACGQQPALHVLA